MCTTCGCGEHHHHDHEHESHRHHSHGNETTVRVETDILDSNNRFAAENRKLFYQNDIKAFNLVSSPGSGKTTLLEATCKALLARGVKVSVIEGDQQTDNDARRIERAGARVVQINTAAGCHLDAHGVGHAVEKLQPERDSLLMIENVGNLVCPAMFDLGEKARVVVISVTEGDDKPLKYPYMFAGSQICVINKTDLLPYVDSDPERIKANARSVNKDLRFFEVSATKGDGMDEWIEFLAAGGK
ncbi:MAG: hydrogenase nickel incorporation protein HypB [Paramuribaculum sp.]|nr:hydrogenase nickel incorporation protein HypB [Paramuribaculum sp.]MDE7470914.1 hydrogenase nickel incorporation protein HypB [Paramuribaculum sp.]